jgi:prolipoprotein diacylglyceryltransferase
LLVLVTLYLWDIRLGKEKRPRGAMISMFFAVYFTGRFLVEYFKEYQAWATGLPLTEGQIYSIFPALLGYYGIYWSLKHKIPAHWYTDADDELPPDDADDEADDAPAKPHDKDVDDEFTRGKA